MGAQGGLHKEHTVERTDATGIANERKRAQTHGHTLARKLKVGDWVAVQARQRWSTKEEVHYRAGKLSPRARTHALAHAACSHQRGVLRQVTTGWAAWSTRARITSSARAS